MTSEDGTGIRQNWEDVAPEVTERREGWEVDKAVELADAGSMTVEGREYDVADVDPEIGFIEARLQAGDESYFTEIRWYESLGYSVEMHSSNVEVSNAE